MMEPPGDRIDNAICAKHDSEDSSALPDPMDSPTGSIDQHAEQAASLSVDTPIGSFPPMMEPKDSLLELDDETEDDEDSTASSQAAVFERGHHHQQQQGQQQIESPELRPRLNQIPKGEQNPTIQEAPVVVTTSSDSGTVEPMPETAAQAMSSWHDPNLSTSMVMTSGSVVASEWVTYIDEDGDDIRSMSLAGSPDRSIARVASAEDELQDPSGETLDSPSFVACFEPFEELKRPDPSVKRVSFVATESEPSPPRIDRKSREDPSATSLDLSVVSNTLSQSFVSASGSYNESINRKIEGWDADIKASVTNLNLMHGFPRGLAFSSARKCRSFFPLRLWLVDNNAATSQGDELQACLDQHIQISETMEVSSIFCLLNSFRQTGDFSISSLSGQIPFSILSTSVVSTLTSPSSLISGNKAIHDDVRHEIAQMIQQSARQKRNIEIPWSTILRDAGFQIESADAQLDHHQQSVVVCISTDEFVITDEVASELLLMQRLPVMIVIRLFGTVGRELKMTELRDKLAVLGLRSIRVLGDLQSHQILVRQVNPWLNYGVPLHRYQEMGMQSRTLSLLSERRLTHHELREFLVVLFGRHVMLEAPDVECEWPSFLCYIKFVNESANKHWNGVTKQTEPWLDIRQLDHIYGMPESRSLIQAIDEIRSQTRHSSTQVEL